MPRRKADALLDTKRSETELIEVLRRIAVGEDIPAKDRVTASRALLELEGSLGRHARDPHARSDQLALSDASLSDLQAELVRLRRRFGAELAGNKPARSRA